MDKGFEEERELIRMYLEKVILEGNAKQIPFNSLSVLISYYTLV